MLQLIEAEPGQKCTKRLPSRADSNRKRTGVWRRSLVVSSGRSIDHHSKEKNKQTKKNGPYRRDQSILGCHRLDESESHFIPSYPKYRDLILATTHSDPGPPSPSPSPSLSPSPSRSPAPVSPSPVSPSRSESSPLGSHVGYRVHSHCVGSRACYHPRPQSPPPTRSSSLAAASYRPHRVSDCCPMASHFPRRDGD